MKVHEAVQLIIDKKFATLVTPDYGNIKFKLDSSGYLISDYGEMCVSNPSLLISNKWTVEDEILPKNVIRTPDGKLVQKYKYERWVDIYINSETKKIHSFTFEKETKDKTMPSHLEYIKTIHVVQDFIIPYVQ